MLIKQDRQEIKKMIKDEVTAALEEFSRDIFLPAFEKMATKEELELLATKDDLVFLATKEELASKPSLAQIQFMFDQQRKYILQDVTEPSIKRDKKLNLKTDTVAVKLETKKVFTKKDIKDIKLIAPLAVSL